MDLLRSIFSARLNLKDASKPILISGCDSGLGFHLATDLANAGARVFAGCLTRDAMDKLSALKLDNLVPVQIDVTDASSVNDAFSNVENAVGDSGLFALVCNAGRVCSSFVDWSSQEDYETELQTNYLGGVVRMTRTFLPLLKKAAKATAPPRIICISSISAYSPVLSFSGYSASKAAIGAFCRAIALELAWYNIKVSCVYPGAHRSPLTEAPNDRKIRAWQKLDAETKSSYGVSFYETLLKELANPQRWQYLPPISSAATRVLDVLSYWDPPRRVFIGADCYVYWLIEWLPWRWQVGVSRWFGLGDARPGFLLEQRKAG
jgi:NAD(P)-dependent dehydrogenase (short-subunit alcohol dehydrogenase family)